MPLRATTKPRQKLAIHVEIGARETIPVLLAKSASGSLSWDNKILNDRHRGHRQGWEFGVPQRTHSFWICESTSYMLKEGPTSRKMLINGSFPLKETFSFRRESWAKGPLSDLEGGEAEWETGSVVLTMATPEGWALEQLRVDGGCGALFMWCWEISKAEPACETGQSQEASRQTNPCSTRNFSLLSSSGCCYASCVLFMSIVFPLHSDCKISIFLKVLAGLH